MAAEIPNIILVLDDVTLIKIAQMMNYFSVFESMVPTLMNL